jgi:hypothetical protein
MHAFPCRLAVARVALAGLCLLLVRPAAAEQHYFACATNDDHTLTLTGYIGSGGEVKVPAAIDGLAVTAIGYEAFYGALGRPTRVTLPDSVTNIGSFAFINCSRLTEIVFGRRVATIGDYAFAFCGGLAAVTLPDSLATIGEASFINCRSLETVAVPDRVTAIGPWAFEYCATLTNGTVGQSVTNIGYGAFRRCPNLVRVTIGRRVASIAGTAFEWCPRLKEVCFLGDAPAAGTDVFGGDDEATVYFLPGTTGWGKSFCDRPAVLRNDAKRE